VNDRRFVNQYQPQTLVVATMLLYIEAVFDLITLSPLLIVAAVLMAAGGYGIANEKRWGYSLAIAVAIIRVVLLFAIFGTDALGFPVILTLIFDGALVALLVHPMSREYQRIWFK